MTLRSTAVYCCGHRLCIVVCTYIIAVFGYLTLWFFDNISTGSNSYILEFAGTISHIERGCGYSAG